MKYLINSKQVAMKPQAVAAAAAAGAALLALTGDTPQKEFHRAVI